MRIVQKRDERKRNVHVEYGWVCVFMCVFIEWYSQKRIGHPFWIDLYPFWDQEYTRKLNWRVVKDVVWNTVSSLNIDPYVVRNLLCSILYTCNTYCKDLLLLSCDTDILLILGTMVLFWLGSLLNTRKSHLCRYSNTSEMVSDTIYKHLKRSINWKIRTRQHRFCPDY